MVAAFQDMAAAVGEPVGHFPPVEHFVALGRKQIITLGPGRPSYSHFSQFVDILG